MDDLTDFFYFSKQTDFSFVSGETGPYTMDDFADFFYFSKQTNFLFVAGETGPYTMDDFADFSRSDINKVLCGSRSLASKQGH